MVAPEYDAGNLDEFLPTFEVKRGEGDVPPREEGDVSMLGVKRETRLSCFNVKTNCFISR